MKLNRHNIILIVYAIIGIPGLPFACLMWLIGRYMFNNRQTKEDFLSWAVVFTLAIGAIYLVVKC